MTTNKIQDFKVELSKAINVLANSQGLHSVDVQKMCELRDMLEEISHLSAYFEQPVAQQVQAQPVAPVQVQAPVILPQAPAAPGAVQLSSGMTPNVEGCIAAQPQSVVQPAAQAQLTTLLAQQKENSAQAAAAMQARLDEELAKKQQQDALTASLQAQVQTATPAPVVQTQAPADLTASLAAQVQATQQVQTAPVEAPVQAIPATPAPAPALSLSQFVQQNAGAPAATQELTPQQKLNQVLAQKQQAPQAPAQGQ